MSGIIMAECQELFWRNVRSYGGMPGVKEKCHELWRNGKSYYDRGMTVVIMAECQGGISEVNMVDKFIVVDPL